MNYIAKAGKIPFLFVFFVVALFFYINGNAFFPEWDSTYGQVISIYMIMMLVFYVFSTSKTEKRIDSPASISTTQFVFGFIISYVAITLLTVVGVLSAGEMAAGLILPTIIMQFCVVAPSEELMFRGVLQDYTGIIVQAILFALWHSYAYGIMWYNLTLSTGIYSFFVALVFGLILGYLSRLPMFSLPGAIAVHATYNCIILGALAI